MPERVDRIELVEVLPDENFVRGIPFGECGVHGIGHLRFDQKSESVGIGRDEIEREKFRELRPLLPPKTLPRVEGTHDDDFLRAIREGRKANSDVSSAGPFTEMVQLSVPALGSQRRIKFDPQTMTIPNAPEAEAFLRMENRPGWIV